MSILVPCLLSKAMRNCSTKIKVSSIQKEQLDIDSSILEMLLGPESSFYSRLEELESHKLLMCPSIQSNSTSPTPSTQSNLSIGNPKSVKRKMQSTAILMLLLILATASSSSQLFPAKLSGFNLLELLK